MHLAAQKVVDKARKVAAHLLEAAEGDVEFNAGTFSVKGSPDAIAWSASSTVVGRAYWNAAGITGPLRPRDS